MAPRSQRVRLASALALGALVWALALVVAALVFPVYHTVSSAKGGITASGSTSLIAGNGPGAATVIIAPAVLAVIAVVALRRKRQHGGRVWGAVAWAIAGALLALAVISSFSIGLFILPTAAGLVAAAKLTPGDR